MRQDELLTQQGLERQRERFERNCAHPTLQQLFLEVTPRCNLSCVHCGSRCDEHTQTSELSLDEYRLLLTRVREAFGTKVFIVLTGGEPLLRRDLFELGSLIRDLGFSWGMTTNGTLIDRACAERLADAGLRTASVSLDGTRAVHDVVRHHPGAFDAAISGIQNLAATGRLAALQATSVINHQTLDQMEPLFDLMVDLPIDSWRLANVEPIGSALDHPDILFTQQDFAQLFMFIRSKRQRGWPVEYGCCHYLGMGLEGQLRNWFWLCNAGIHVMSVMHDGSIGSCLDIERTPETIFGNVRTDDIARVWREGFGVYRAADGLASRNGTCAACSQRRHCRGDSAHSWDFDRNEPRICPVRDLPFFIPAPQ